MTREEAIKEMIRAYDVLDFSGHMDNRRKEAFNMAKVALEQEPCGNCIEFKRYAKQKGFSIEKESIPYLMHKEMDIPIAECQKAYDVAIEYLRSQSKMKG